MADERERAARITADAQWLAENLGIAVAGLFRIGQGVEDASVAAEHTLRTIGATDLADMVRNQRPRTPTEDDPDGR